MKIMWGNVYCFYTDPLVRRVGILDRPKMGRRFLYRPARKAGRTASQEGMIY